ncbi:MAG: hypothetical protein IJS09_10610 [Treponema sp.]|nr:hypothetical protein [Treponema sp.]
MKKLSAAFLGLLVVVFSACNDLDSNDTVVNANGKAYLSLTVNKIGSVRVISPTNLTKEDITKAELLYKPSGNSTAEQTVLKTWTALSVMETENTLVINPGTYDFTLNLYAKQIINDEEKEMLAQIGTLTQEVVEGTNVLAFTTAYNPQGSGALSITAQIPSNSKVSSVEAGLFSVTNKGLIGDALESFSPEPITVSDDTVTYEKDSVPAGKYWLQFKMYQDGVTDPVYDWQDIVKIASACTTKKEDVIISAVNTVYSITYVIQKDGEDVTYTWADGYTPPTKRNANTGVILPDGDYITFTGDYANYIFLGWFISSDFTEDSEIEGIGTGPVMAKDITLYGKIVPPAPVSGSVTTDNRAVNISISDTTLYLNSTIRFSAKDADNNDLINGVTYNAELLYQGKNVNTLGDEVYYYVNPEYGKLTMNQANPLPKEGTYQLYVTMSQPVNNSNANIVTSSQTFDVTFKKELGTPETSVVLYNYDYNDGYSFYLVDSSKVEYEQLKDATMQTSSSKTTFDIYGNFYCLYNDSSYAKLKSNNPAFEEKTLGELSDQLGRYSCDFVIDMANNKAYAWSGKYTSYFTLYRYPKLFTTGETEAETITFTTSGFNLNNIAIYNDILYAVGSEESSPYDTKIITYNISNIEAGATVSAESAISTYNLTTKFSKDSGGIFTSNWTITDVYALEDALYLLVHECSFLYNDSYKTTEVWSNTEKNIYNRGAVVKYVAPVNGNTEALSHIGLKTDMAYEDTSISQLYLYTSNYGPFLASDFESALVLTIDGNHIINSDTELLCNKYFPNIYTISDVTDMNFASPAKFIAIKPKRLVIADDGLAFYSDADGLSYKNIDRVITIDLEQFVIENVQPTTAHFSEQEGSYLRSDISTRTISNENGGYYDADTVGYYYNGSEAKFIKSTIGNETLYLAIRNSDNE